MIFTPVVEVPGAWTIDPERVSDDRGWFARTWALDELRSHGLDTTVVQISSSFNPRAGTLRGMHLQRAPHAEVKLIRCTRGAAFDVMVDLRRGTPGFGRWAGFELDPESGRAVYLPEGVAHGFLTLAPDTELSYQISAAYQPDAAIGFRWDDPEVAIAWPAEPSLLSDRDRGLPNLSGLTALSEEIR
ncbi:dTDP-4-dehydrorhamnose 3,5-epimerase [soil metagenome]